MSNTQIIKKGNELFQKTSSCKRNENQVNNMLNILRNKMLYNGKEIHTIIVNKEIYFKSKEIIEILEYVNTNKTLLEKVTNKNK